VIDAERALTALIELTARLTAERSLNASLQLVSDTALQLLPGDHASIRVLDHTRTELLSGARSGSGLGKRPVRHVAGQGVAGWVVDHGEIARVGDARLDPRFVPKQNQGFEIRAMLAVPLWSAGEVVGVLAVTSQEPERYGPEHEPLCQLLANCAVPPIEKARLARLAVTDSHTLAFNQAYLAGGIQAEMERLRGTASPLSLLLMDLDHFKTINDRYGHAAGDRALREFADRVRATTRDVDVMVRRGGDEFVLIMAGSGRESALAVAERIRAAMERTPDPGSRHAVVVPTVSIGVATWDGHETPEALEARADEAMYEAKLRGRNRVCVSAGESRSADSGGEAPPTRQDNLPTAPSQVPQADKLEEEP
jgi:two-component system cell cycle response regulator